MATYEELYVFRSDDELLRKVAVACAVKAQALIDSSTPTSNELTWSAATLSDPLAVAGQLLNYVLAANKSATPAQISAASDSTIQGNVDDAVDKLTAGGAV